MSEQPHFAKAPILEAIIHLRVVLSEEAAVERLAELHGILRDRYPEIQNMYEAEVSFEIGDHPKAENRQRHNGFRLLGSDKHSVIQARDDGFAFSQLAPYDRWEAFRDAAREMWNVYHSVAHPLKVTRLAVRYINRLDIPYAPIELTDWLRTVPEISPALRQVVESYFMNLAIPQEDIGAKAIINQTLVPPPSPDTTSVVLDIDLFQECDLRFDAEEIWTRFEQLRARKNEIFVGCLTDKAQELIS